MLGRFFQLFLLASLVLLLPSLFYLSREKQVYESARDYALMQTSGGRNVNGKSIFDGVRVQQDRPQRLTQGSQGHGPPPALDPAMAQAWKWTNAHLLGWGKGNKGTASKESDSVAAKAGGVARPEGAIMPKMENATAKAELGRATWRFLHTMTLRFPDHPSLTERETLLRFFHDFAALYPCGDCARHFQQLLKDLPPQTSSRMASALWLCTAHNMVNARLGKPEFPCDKLDETYDCGCGPEGANKTASVATAADGTSTALPDSAAKAPAAVVALD